ncbi:MFS transporter [Reichenbachiella carrageenanivorans]|uniref:MFS transporter n=1 Tax=Reichenbachiella carrageenanivorans TaxID=2979869 RepID=A0ABY6CZM8_9BACT|nr:MFS transporter [Reichenbachiella carrageenanivorans]UXX79360.1 MFS transporter [Reichenbachiella carrageenanivorans]
MIKKIQGEIRFFNEMPRDMRILLMTNMIYALVLPIIEIFVSAYIMRSLNSSSAVILYQITVFTGIPITFVLNGFLLRKFSVKGLYSLGMILSGISISVMMFLKDITFVEVGISGLLMGISYGFFWSNRDFLAIETTEDNNRNYYYGLETFFYTITGIAVPAVIGFLFVLTSSYNLFDGDATAVYRVITIAVFLLTVLSSIVIHRGSFKNPKVDRIIYFRFDKLWRKLLVLASLKGMTQGYLVTVPAILILRLVGDESTLSSVQSISGIVTAIVLYVLGRISKPQHRIYIFSLGYVIFFVGALTHSLLFSSFGVIVFVMCKVLYQPLHDIAYFPIQMKVINYLSELTKRSEFSYIVNHEFGLYVGRFLGLSLFIVLDYYISESFAIRYSLVVIGIIQMLSIPLAKTIIQESKHEKA